MPEERYTDILAALTERSFKRMFVLTVTMAACLLASLAALIRQR